MAKNKPGRDFGESRNKFPVGKIAKALQLRADGHRLEHISQQTGLSMSYISRLSRQFLARGKGRVSAATTAAQESLLTARLKKIETEARGIREQLKKLRGGSSGKPSNSKKSGVGAAPAAGAHSAPGTEVFDVRDPAEGSR